MFGGSTVKTSRVIRHSCIKIVPRQPFSAKSNNNPSHSSAIKHVEEANKKSESVTAASAIKDTALSKINSIASQATQLAKSKATNAVTHASNTIRTSLHNTKVNAKIKTEQYAWEAHRSLNKARTEMETKIKNKANQTREQIQQSVKEELSKRIPQIGGGGNSVQAQTKSSATAAQTEPTTALKNSIPNDKIKQSLMMPSSISSLLPSKESILSSATTTALSNAATETLNRTTTNLSTQFSSTIHKAFKWLWWWSLAAVGVYGISTTLTKEGVALLKDVVVGGTASTSLDEKKSSSLSSTLSSVSKDDEVMQAEAVVVESDYVNDGFEVVPENSSSKQEDPPNQERWSSWLSSWRKGSK
jgi:vacuolar-type H+-ATPase subunit E/Vma4